MELLRILRFRARGITLRDPALPTFDRLVAAVAAAVGRTDEVAIGEFHPSDAATGPAIFQRTILNGDLAIRFERISIDPPLKQLRRRGGFKTPECLAAV